MVSVWFSWNIVVIIVQRGLKRYNFTILAAGDETEQVCNPAIMYVFDQTKDRTKLNLER